MRGYADPPKIKPIRIPASLHRDVGISPFMRVPRTRSMQQIEFSVGQVEQFSSLVLSKISGSWAVVRIDTFIDSL